MSAKPDKTELERLLSIYIDGACSDAERQVVEAALASDPALRALHAQLTRTVQCVRAIGAEPAPSHARERILSQLERRALLDDGRGAPRRSSAFRPWVALATAAMVLVAAGAGWWVYTTRIAPPDRTTMFADRSLGRPAHRAKTAEPGATAHGSPQAVGQVAMAPPARPEIAAPSAPMPASHSFDRTMQSPPPDGRPGLQSAGGDLHERSNSIADATPALAEASKGTIVTDEDYRVAAARALVARELAAREVAAAEEASKKATERVAAAQAAAQELAAVRAAVASRPAATSPMAGLAVVPPTAPAAPAKANDYGGEQNVPADTGHPAVAVAEDAADSAVPQVAEEYRLVLHPLVLDAGRVGALELRVSTADRVATVGAAQMAVQQLGGRLMQLAMGPDSSIVVATVPDQSQYLLMDQIAGIQGVTGVQVSQLAADSVSLEIASILSQPAVIWYPNRHVSSQPVDRKADVPVRIVIRLAGEGS